MKRLSTLCSTPPGRSRCEELRTSSFQSGELLARTPSRRWRSARSPELWAASFVPTWVARGHSTAGTCPVGPWCQPPCPPPVLSSSAQQTHRCLPRLGLSPSWVSHHGRHPALGTSVFPLPSHRNRGEAPPPGSHEPDAPGPLHALFPLPGTLFAPFPALPAPLPSGLALKGSSLAGVPTALPTSQSERNIECAGQSLRSDHAQCSTCSHQTCGGPRTAQLSGLPDTRWLL